MATFRIVAPLLAAYLLFLGIVASSACGPEAPRRESVADGGWDSPLLRLVSTAVGGDAVFLLIVLVFHVVIAGQREAMTSALVGGSLLAFGVATPAFVLLSWIDHGVRCRRRRMP